MLDASNTALLARLSERAKASTVPAGVLVRARSMTSELAAMCGPGPAMTAVRDDEVQTTTGSFPVRLYSPTTSPRGVLVYFHGGGWMLGTIDDFDAFARTLAAQSGCAVVSVGYRLAPEHPYPTGIDDAWAAVQWTASHVKSIAGRPVPLIVAGDSAGGNLAAVVCQRAHAAGEPHIALQVLAYPITDSRLDTESYEDPRNQLLLSRKDMVRCWDFYCPDPGMRAHADLSPLRANDLRGLPPAAILTAGYDVLLTESRAYADRLADAGVPVQRLHFDDQMHGFLTLVNVLPASSEAVTFIAQAVGDLT